MFIDFDGYVREIERACHIDFPIGYVVFNYIVQILAVLFCFALLQCKKWGFWGILFSGVVSIYNGLLMDSTWTIITSITAIIFLYVFLSIKINDDKTSWENLT